MDATKRGPRGDRGQTALDLAVGIGVFLLVVTFAAGFMPEMYAPFDDEPQRPQVADRSADRLVATLAESPANPSVLNESCTVTVLRGTNAGCGYDPSEDLTEHLGVGSRYRLNVSLRRNVTADPGLELLCTDGSDVTDCTAGSDRLALGPAPPTDRSSVDTTRRVVYVDGRDATVVVSVW